MIICIQQVLTISEREQLLQLMEHASFVDGKTTAGWHALAVKNNLQLAPSEDALLSGTDIVLQASMSHELFRAAARPKQMSPILFSKYLGGMHYGSHVDDAFMGNLRSDLSYTLFLSDPSSYDGGELVIDQTQGEQEFKLQAGDLILYPSTTLHRVEPVTRGERLAAVGWVQSCIRRADQRELLFDLERARLALFGREGKSAEFDLISKSFTNLLRMWGE
jgi:PKHD-type hydroxylase